MYKPESRGERWFLVFVLTGVFAFVVWFLIATDPLQKVVQDEWWAANPFEDSLFVTTSADRWMDLLRGQVIAPRPGYDPQELWIGYVAPDWHHAPGCTLWERAVGWDMRTDLPTMSPREVKRMDLEHEAWLAERDVRLSYGVIPYSGTPLAVQGRPADADSVWAERICTLAVRQPEPVDTQVVAMPDSMGGWIESFMFTVTPKGDTLVVQTKK